MRGHQSQLGIVSCNSLVTPELPDLKVLWLADNPITELSGYRQSVLEILPHLSKLDNISMSYIDS